MDSWGHDANCIGGGAMNGLSMLIFGNVYHVPVMPPVMPGGAPLSPPALEAPPFPGKSLRFGGGFLLRVTMMEWTARAFSASCRAKAGEQGGAQGSYCRRDRWSRPARQRLAPPLSTPPS
jgi:hypothetical protein